MKLIGASKIAKNNKVTLVETVAEQLKIGPGDVLVYLLSTTGDIIIREQSSVKIKE